MQLLKGIALDGWLAQGNRPTLKQALRIARETARGLEAAHAHGLIHRDIKPANLWLEDRSQGTETRATISVRVKILDFGLARPTETDNELTRQGTILGSPSFMSPEQARGKPLDGRSDLFSLGCVLYRLLTGELPFTAPDTLALLYALSNVAHRPVRELNPEVPEIVAEMVDRLMAKDPEDRPTSARLAAEALQAIERELAGKTTSAPVTPPQKQRTMHADAPPKKAAKTIVAEKEPGNRRWLMAGLAAGIGVMLVSCLSCGLVGFLRDWGVSGAPAIVDKKPPAGNPTPPVADAPGSPAVTHAPFSEERAREYQEQWGTFLKTKVHDANSLGMKLVLIPPGEFDMGASEEDFQKHVQKFGKFFTESSARRSSGEGPVHKVRITRPMLFATTVVTVGQFREFAREQKYRTEADTNSRGGTAIVEVGGGGGGGKFGKGFKLPPLEKDREDRRSDFTWEKPGFKPSDQHPVCNVTWADADAFCRWLSAREGKTYRLPTEAEWEFACRAGTTGPWSNGESASAKGSLSMWTHSNSKREPHPVAQWAANPFGLYDMHGNVGELCADFFDPDYYAVSPSDDPLAANDRGKGHVVRGGSFHEPPTAARSAHRAGSGIAPSVTIGFRVVCEIGGELRAK
jgi:formylglycine-generating enzyme required for sulfatase activity